MSVALPAIFSKITSRADKSYKIEFESRELGEEAATLMGLLQTEGWLLFSPNELQEADVPDEKADSMTRQKTQAQRTRGIIYRIWEAKGKPGTSEEYYQRAMSAINDQLKEELSRLTD
jgi:hypothetical protein